MPSMEKKFVIYKGDKVISLKDAKAIDPDMPALYWGQGSESLSNPLYCQAMLVYLRDSNQIDSFVYKGEVVPLEQEEGVVY